MVDKTKIIVQNEKNLVTVDVYVDGILNHTSTVDKIDGKVTEKVGNKINTFKIENYENISNNIKTEGFISNNRIGERNVRSFLPGFYYMEHWSGHIGNPNLVGFLWGKDTVNQGPAKSIQFSPGTLVGTVVGIIVSFIPGINALGIII